MQGPTLGALHVAEQSLLSLRVPPPEHDVTLCGSMTMVLPLPQLAAAKF
jgi:hypothetical protein